MKTGIRLATCLFLAVFCDVVAADDAVGPNVPLWQKRQYVREHAADYRNGTLQHHVPLEQMKMRALQIPGLTESDRSCINDAATPEDLRACRDAIRQRYGSQSGYRGRWRSSPRSSP